MLRHQSRRSRRSRPVPRRAASRRQEPRKLVAPLPIGVAKPTKHCYSNPYLRPGGGLLMNRPRGGRPEYVRCLASASPYANLSPRSNNRLHKRHEQSILDKNEARGPGSQRRAGAGLLRFFVVRSNACGLSLVSGDVGFPFECALMEHWEAPTHALTPPEAPHPPRSDHQCSSGDAVNV